MNDSIGATAIPTEIWIAIIGRLSDIRDLVALGQANRGFHALVNPLLYRQAASSCLAIRAIFWGVRHSLFRTVRNAVAAGVNADTVWNSDLPAHCLEDLVPSFRECLHSSKRSSDLSAGLHENEWDERSSHWSPLHLATFLGNLEMMALLLDLGASPNSGSSRLCRCFDFRFNDRILKTSYNFYIPRYCALWTPYHVAICTGHIAAAELLLSRVGGGEIECFNGYTPGNPTGLSPIHVASISGHEHMIEWLITSKGADVETLHKSGKTPLMYAFLYRNLDAFSCLLRHGADINRVYGNHRLDEDEDEDEDEHRTRNTLLCLALTPDMFEDALWLLELGADPVIANNACRIEQGELPLIHNLCLGSWLRHPYYWERDEEALITIREAGLALLDRFLADGLDFRQTVPNIHDPHEPGQTALGYAAHAGNLEAVKRLLEAGADVNGNPQEDRRTPLASACVSGSDKPSLELVTLLINSGASVNRLRNGTQSPLWVISRSFPGPDPPGCELQAFQVESLLLEHGSNPGRGTSSGDFMHDSALDKLLRDQELDLFDRLLKKCPRGLLGADDFLGFWDIVTDKRNPKAARVVLENDVDRVIALQEREAVSYLLSQDPVELDLVLMLVEHGPRLEFGSHGNESLQTILTKSAWPVPERLDITRALLNAGVSIYQHQVPNESHFLSTDVINTALGTTIHWLEPCSDFLQMMLEHQPMRDSPSVSPLPYIIQACKVGNFKALNAIVKSTEQAVLEIQQHANKLIHYTLDGMIPRKMTIMDLNATIDCIQFLFQNGADISSSNPIRQSDPRTTEQKLQGLMNSPSPVHSSDPKALAWCAQRRIKWTDSARLPTFEPETMALYFQRHISLDQIGRILKDGSRHFSIVPPRQKGDKQ